MSLLEMKVAAFVMDDSGQDLVEYALVIGVLGLGAVSAMKGLATKLTDAFATMGTTVTSNV